MKPAPFAFFSPASIDDAFAALHKHGTNGVLLAGGQSLVPKLNLRLLRPSRVISLAQLDDLRGVSADDNGITIGALTTHAGIEDLTSGDRLSSALRTIASGIASRGVRNRATMGGCLVNGDPRHDWLVALPALGAQLRLRSANGERQISATDWLSAPGTTAIQRDEILISIRVPALGEKSRWGYAKLSRKTNAIPLAIAAVRLDRDQTRLVVGTAFGIFALGEIAAALTANKSLPGNESLAAEIRRIAPQHDWYDASMAAEAVRRAIEGAR